MLERIKKHFALQAYVKKLGPLLRKKFGKNESYTPGQVKTTVQINNLNEKYSCYAYVLFCKQSGFNQELDGREDLLGYQTIKKELGDKFFDGKQNFNTSDVMKIGSNSVWWGSPEDNNPENFTGGSSGGGD
jgi:hypothetical protein